MPTRCYVYTLISLCHPVARLDGLEGPSVHLLARVLCDEAANCCQLRHSLQTHTPANTHETLLRMKYFDRSSYSQSVVASRPFGRGQRDVPACGARLVRNLSASRRRRRYSHHRKGEPKLVVQSHRLPNDDGTGLKSLKCTMIRHRSPFYKLTEAAYR